MFLKKNKDMNEEKNKIINNIKNNKAYFSNCDFYSNEKDFLIKITQIISNNKISSYEHLTDNDADFETCINFLVKNEYLKFEDENVDFATFLIKMTKEVFNVNIDKNMFDKKYEAFSQRIKRDKFIDLTLKKQCMCELLEEQGYGLIYLYSVGDFYSYGVVTLEQIEQLEKLFNLILK